MVVLVAVAVVVVVVVLIQSSSRVNHACTAVRGMGKMRENIPEGVVGR